MAEWQLHSRLAADTHLVGDLSLCRVLLMNDARHDWLILVPRRASIREVYELPPPDQTDLWQEATAVGQQLIQAVSADKLNIATLGNMVPQLHVHVIARKVGDAAWPGPVWGIGEPDVLSDRDAAQRAARLAVALHIERH